MAQFKAFSSSVEVNGESVFSIVDGMGAFKQTALMILAQNNIDNPKPGDWFKQQDWLNAFQSISDKIGDEILYSIGVKIPENAQFPPDIDNIEKALSAIDVAYHMNHRNGEIGHYNFEKVGANKAKLVCDNPYPCHFDRGIIEAMAKRFKPAGSSVTVQHDDSAPCRKNGGDSCTYNVAW